MAAQHETIQFRPRATQPSADADHAATGRDASRSRGSAASIDERRRRYGVRPAVIEHTPAPKGLLGRLRLPSLPKPPELPEVSLPSSPLARHAVIVVGFLAVVLIFLYGPVRSLYAATRDEQVYSAQLAELNASNEALRAEVDTLQSREGIEDEARKRGYVPKGETPVVVDGLEVDDRGTADAAASADLTLSDEDPWYVDVLDVVFGYEVPELVSK